VEREHLLVHVHGMELKVQYYQEWTYADEEWNSV